MTKINLSQTSMGFWTAEVDGVPVKFEGYNLDPMVALMQALAVAKIEVERESTYWIDGKKQTFKTTNMS